MTRNDIPSFDSTFVFKILKFNIFVIILILGPFDTLNFFLSLNVDYSQKNSKSK